ncbi:hypothetical protein [Methylicorpusculum sp.]|uniref:hypothetical protein n=1 Tax=Methylicorpusculum sp. TaxID=2713644 RepID=UPI0027320423|nr:hypothetical protein [Methylicorpusculum sp.]
MLTSKPKPAQTMGSALFFCKSHHSVMANNSPLQKIQSGALFQVGTLDLQGETGQKYLVPKLQLGNAYPQAQLYEHLF